MRKVSGKILRYDRRAVCSLDLKRLGITLINANDNCPFLFWLFRAYPPGAMLGGFLKRFHLVFWGLYGPGLQKLGLF